MLNSASSRVRGFSSPTISASTAVTHFCARLNLTRWKQPIQLFLVNRAMGYLVHVHANQASLYAIKQVCVRIMQPTKHALWWSRVVPHVDTPDGWSLARPLINSTRSLIRLLIVNFLHNFCSLQDGTPSTSEANSQPETAFFFTAVQSALT